MLIKRIGINIWLISYSMFKNDMGLDPTVSILAYQGPQVYNQSLFPYGARLPRIGNNYTSQSFSFKHAIELRTDRRFLIIKPVVCTYFAEINTLIKMTQCGWALGTTAHMIVKDKPTVVWEYMLRPKQAGIAKTVNLEQRCCHPIRLKKETPRSRSATESKRRRLAPLGDRDGTI